MDLVLADVGPAQTGVTREGESVSDWCYAGRGVCLVDRPKTRVLSGGAQSISGGVPSQQQTNPSPAARPLCHTSLSGGAPSERRLNPSSAEHSSPAARGPGARNQSPVEDGAGTVKFEVMLCTSWYQVRLELFRFQFVTLPKQGR